MRPRLSYIGTAALVLALLGAAPPQQQVSQSGTVDADADIEIFNLLGSVRVTGWDRNEVSVEATLGEGTERLEFRNNGGDVEIRVVVPRARRRNPNRVIGESHLEIMVPRTASLDIENRYRVDCRRRRVGWGQHGKRRRSVDLCRGTRGSSTPNPPAATSTSPPRQPTLSSTSAAAAATWSFS